MPVPLIKCRNRQTGATAEIPETALGHMTDWVRLDRDPEPDSDFEATAQDQQTTAEPATATEQPEPQPSEPTRKSKAAKANES